MRNKLIGLTTFAVAGTLLSDLWLASAAPPPTPPDGDAGIQQWFSDRESLGIELNNTLFETQQLSWPSLQSATTCQALGRISQRLLGGASAPHPDLDTVANAGIAQFGQAAEACLAGDFALMRQRIDDGTALRADAQQTLDHITDGQYYGH